MPRKVRDAALETRSARARLRVAHRPYFRLIEPGLHLGFRKLASGPGTWLVRRYVGDGRYIAENLRTADGALVLADDFEDADGARVLSFAQAQQAARGRGQSRSVGAYTVANATDDYLRFLESDGRSPHSVRDARYRVEAFVRPRLGTVKLAALTSDQLRRWRDETAKAPPRLRTRNGNKQKHREMVGEDAKRARRATVNRTWNMLRAALNHAFNDGKADSDLAWRKVKPFRRVDATRVRYLSIAESKRLINACDPEFRLLVQAGLLTGARYGELCAGLEVSDFNPDSGTLAIRQSKSGKSRHVVLTEEGVAFFAQLTAGREGTEPMFRKQWRKSQQARPMVEACRRAKINPPVGIHQLRHTYASLCVMNGVPLAIVAQNLGHADTRMCERHYAHLAPSYVAEAIRRGAPRFGFRSDSKLATLSSRR
jgi:integrase